MAKFEKNSDEPITSKKGVRGDKFGRSYFAEGLAEALIKVPNNESFTVGLHGAWGSGKTSIIKLAEEYIVDKYKDDVIIIPFNPWLFSTAEGLHMAFFGALAQYLGASLSTKKEDILNELRSYGELTGAVGSAVSVVVPFAGTAKLISPIFNKFFSKKSGSSVDDIKDRVNKILLESNKRIIVVVDDIDRLDSEEIHLVFKLVKNVAHFNNISYLLAFDQNVVTKALAERYPDEPEIGGNFVDKIVQLPLFVPPVDREVLNQFIINQIDAIATKHKLNNSTDDVLRFSAEYRSLLVHKFTTPRKAIRYLNAVDFTFERLANEANFTDVMLVEAMRVFDPGLYNRISSKKSVLIDRGHYSNRNDNDKKKAKIEVFGAEQMPSWQGVIVRKLFPSFEWALGGSSYAGDYIKGWDEEQRVCSDKYFDRYFNYGIPVDDVADAKIKELIILLDDPKITQDKANKALSKLISAGHPDMLVSKLRNKEETYSQMAAEKLAYALVDIGGSLPRPRQSFLGDTFSSYVQSSILAVSLAQKSNNTVKILKDFMNSAPLDYAEQLIRWIRVDTENKNKSENFIPLITETQLKEIGKLFAKRIKEYSDDHNLVMDFDDDLMALLWNWSHWGSCDEIKIYLNKLFFKDSKNIIYFINAWVGYKYDLSNGKRSRSEFRRDHYDEMKKYIDPSIIATVLNEIYGDDINNSSGFLSNRIIKDESEDKMIARQFMFIHNTVNNEKSNPELITE